MLQDIFLTPEEMALKQEVRAFVKQEVSSDLIRRMDRDEVTYPREFVKALGDRNLLGLRFDKKYGGRGLAWSAEIAALEESLKDLGEKIQPHCLVLIETTVPPGTTEYVAYPILKKAFEGRGIATEPLLAHSYERVMPGREYVASIRDFWRVCSGINFFSSFPVPGSAATASPRTAAWASGPTRPSWASRMTSSRSLRSRSTSTTPAPSTWRSSSGTPSGTWGRSAPPRRSPRGLHDPRPR